MDEDSVILSRIISGLLIFEYNNEKYCLIYPSTRLKYEADLFYTSIYDDYKYSDWLTKDRAIDALKEYSIWNDRKEQEFTSLDRQIEVAKIDLFKSFMHPKKQKSIRLKLKGLKTAKEKYYQLKHSLDHMTLEGYCENMKNQFLIIHSLFILNEQDMIKKFDDIDNIDYCDLESLANTIIKHNIEMSVFRKLARNETWKNYWSANSSNIFSRPAVDWTDEQRTLVLFTKMYDSARESMNCPPDQVFDDDDMFDGWMLLQHEESKKDKQTKLEEKALGNKMAKAQEMFFFAGEAKDAMEIHELNSNTSKAVIKERNQAIKTNKNVAASELPDTKRELFLRNQEMLKNKIRNKS